MSYLTIGIPTYNGAFNLDDLFQSISLLGLREDQFEILIVDNASTDETAVIVEKLLKKVLNLRFYRNENNIGRIENWNKVIELAKGDYLILMNVNDRFIDFDLITYINYLDHNPDISLVMSDIVNVYPLVTYSYPDWDESGNFTFSNYIKNSFLNPDVLEFYSLGVLHQHIFRLNTIRQHHIKFDSLLPRTTDRVFVAQVITSGNSTFYYTGKAMVKWVANQYRYHFATQQNLKNFDFNSLWLNEYKANLILTSLAGISLRNFLKSQAMYAKYMHYAYRLKKIVDFVKKTEPSAELEEISARAYYYYIMVQCDINNIKLNFFNTDFYALRKKLMKPLRRFKLLKKAARLISDI